MKKHTRRSVIKQTSAASGFIGLMGTTAGKKSNTVVIAGASITYEPTEELSDGYELQYREMDPIPDFRIAGEEIQSNPGSQDEEVVDLLRSTNTVVNFGGFQAATNGVQFKNLRADRILDRGNTQTGAARSIVSKSDVTHPIPRFKIQPNGNEFTARHRSTDVAIPEGESRTLSLPPQEVNIYAAKALDTFADAPEGLLPAREVEYEERTVEMDPTLKVKNFGELEIDL